MCILDPAYKGADAGVYLKVPPAFLSQIAKGTFELGEGDEPTNMYTFGRKAEFFQQTFHGTCSCQSGYVGFKLAENLKNTPTDQQWAKLRARIDTDQLNFPDQDSGLLFAGPIVQASTVSVYKLLGGGRVAGLLLHADVDGAD